jgi:hypothetical protein
MKIWITVISHEQGSTTTCAGITKESCHKQLADFCREWWKNEGPRYKEMPTEDVELVKLYFEASSDCLEVNCQEVDAV